jgi:hypothetical protein
MKARYMIKEMVVFRILAGIYRKKFKTHSWHINIAMKVFLGLGD